MAKSLKKRRESRFHAKEVDLATATRMLEAFDGSRRLMDRFQKQRRVLIQKFVSHYGEQDAEKATPVNLMRMAVTIYRRLVAARAPSVLVTPMTDQSLWPMCDSLELAINSEFRRIDLAAALDEWVMQSMFSIGVLKCGLAEGGERVVGAEDAMLDVGAFFASPVDFDDLLLDLRATWWPQMQFIGDRSEVPLPALHEAGYDDVQAVQPRDQNEQGSLRVSSLTTQGDWSGDRGYLDVARIWEVFLPHEQQLLLIEADEAGGFGGGRILKVLPWDDRKEGPYHTLFFEKPPSNIMPTPPTAHLVDMHESVNRTMRKIDRQVARQKTVTMYQSGAKEDAKRVQKANDGDMVQVENTQSIAEVRFSGPDGPSLAYMLQGKDLFSYIAFNMDALGGLGRQANTVGQESIIARAANTTVSDMQDRTTRSVAGVAEHCARLIVSDPAKTYKLMKRIPDTDFGIPIAFGPKDRKGMDIHDYGVNVSPFSMQSRTPSERIQTLVDAVTNLAMPMNGSLEKQGMTIDLKAMFEIIAKYSDTPELRKVIRQMTPQERAVYDQMAQQAGADRPLQSPVTTRNTVRNSGAAEGKSDTAQAVAALMTMKQPASGGKR